MSEAVLKWRGETWPAQEFANLMAHDACLIALGGEPLVFTTDDVLLWLKAQIATGLEKPGGAAGQPPGDKVG